VVRRNITFDNQLLSLLVETGVPATLLYLGLLARLLLRYRRNIRAGRVPPAGEGALTFVLSASLIHFLICDGLYFPQTNWFFHVMLGLAAGGLATAAQAKES
jgi:O-antigen ligase